MDTITHGLAGSVLSRSLAARAGARAALVAGMLAAMLPDADVLFLRTRLDYLRFHRGWTHSFLVLPFLAFGVALLLRPLFRGQRLTMLWLFAAVGVASHIVFDWITSFGTMFFFPLSRHRYSLDWIFILDPIFTGIVFAALVFGGVFRSRARAISLAATGALAMYVAFCALQHARALAAWRAADRPPPGVNAAALPQFLSPFRWLGLSEWPDAVHVAFFDVGPFARGVADPKPPQRFAEILGSLSDWYPPPSRMQIRRFPQPPPSAALEAARALPGTETYLEFARFPRATVRRGPDGGTLVFWEDLRFLPWFAGPWEIQGRGIVRRRPFLFRVRLDAAGRALDGAVVSTFRSP